MASQSAASMGPSAGGPSSAWHPPGVPMSARPGGVPNYGGVSPFSPKDFDRGGMLFHVRSIGALVVVPFLMYSILVLTWALLGYYHLYLGLVVSLICLCWTGLFMVVHVSTAQQGSMYLFLFILCCLAMQGGIYSGLSIQKGYYMPYYEYTSRPTYTDVTPGDPAASRADGGVIGFTSNTIVDTLQGASVLSSKDKAYCVAPILDEAQQSRAEFWAVGTNCCEKHVGFYCDSARDPKANRGLVVFNTGSSLFADETYERYLEAVKIAAATDQVTSPETPVLVRWITDSDQAVSGYWSGGVVNLVISLGIGLLVFIVAAVVLHGLSSRLGGSPHG